MGDEGVIFSLEVVSFGGQVRREAWDVAFPGDESLEEEQQHERDHEENLWGAAAGGSVEIKKSMLWAAFVRRCRRFSNPLLQASPPTLLS